jgi:hypothetical protein
MDALCVVWEELALSIEAATMSDIDDCEGGGDSVLDGVAYHSASKTIQRKLKRPIQGS